MDFNTSTTLLPQDLLHRTTNNAYLFDEFDQYDDDVYYCELKRQVLQLTADDDDQDFDVKYKINPDKVVATAHKQGLISNIVSVRDKGYYDWPENKDDFAPPAWISNLWRTGNGTGVFIPQIAQPRRTNRPRRKRNQRGRTYKRVEKI